MHIVFSEHIQAYEIPYFRAAVIEKSKRESNLFHNHIDEEKVIYRYPLIQYKIKDRKPSLVCLAEATEDIHYLLKQKDFRFRIGKEMIDFEIEDVRLKYEHIQVWDTMFSYNIHNWMALNQDNYSLYKALTRLSDKIAFLEEMLEKHLRIFMEGLGIEENIPLQIVITELKGEKHIEYKDIFHLTFSLNFRSNLLIPDYVGIGKGVSVGFGIVKRINDDQNKRTRKNYE